MLLIVPLERWFLALGWSRAGIDRTLTSLVYGWVVVVLVVTLVYYRRVVNPAPARPRLAYGIAAGSLVAAAGVAGLLYLSTGNPLLAWQRAGLHWGGGGLTFRPDPREALQEYQAGQFQRALPLLEELVARGSKDRSVHLALARTYVRVGQNLEAARTYQEWLRATPGDSEAMEGFLGIYGYPDYRPERPLTPPAPPRPAERQMLYRTSGDSFQVLQEGKWRTVYLVGVNIGPAQPGQFPSTAPRDFNAYYGWFQDIGAMNANTIRTYSVLPPAFYQALEEYNRRTQRPLWLIQEVWIDDATQDLYDPQNQRQFEQEMRNVLDLLHGQADIPCRPGANCGIYTADVSRYVIGLAVGREIEPVLALRTNRLHPEKRSYQGTYVSLREGNPTEAWFAEACDFAIRYETEKYNMQRPITVVNWPPLDPLAHPYEATFAQELQFRKRDGEGVAEKVPEDVNDMDAVSLDVMRFKTQPEFAAGLFALYHVYQHWPDFLFHEPGYGSARDAEGPNRYLGYLRDLKRAHRNFPLLIGEYGLSTSWGVAHLHPQGWNNGGFTEQAQADLLSRFTNNIRDTGCAGGLVFEWQDEWFKHVHDLYTADFEVPQERDRLWRNELDPEEHFGVVGYEPVSVVPLLRGRASDWQRARVLYSRPVGTAAEASAGPIKTVSALADYAYLYLRLDVDAQGKAWWNEWNYWVALNTLPGQAGSRALPDLGVRVESGANFLLRLRGPGDARLLIAREYNPNESVPVLGVPDIRRKPGMNVQLVDRSAFEDMVTDANKSWYRRDGQWFPPRQFNRSIIAQGVADPTHADYSSHALWNADPNSGMVEIRLPWGLLYVTDPSSLQAFAGTDERRRPKTRTMSGISVMVFAVRAGRLPRVGGSFPALSGGRVVEEPARFLWQPWDEVQVQRYFKQSYYSLQLDWERMQTAKRKQSPSAP